MTYQALARKYRPQRFADLLGQEAAVQTLQNAIAADTVGHAYLFSGLRGVGKTTAARLLAKAVNCDDGPTPDPCGVCTSCTEIAEGASIDVVEIDAATHTQVDNVRDLQELLRFRPVRDRFRVVIVDEAHMLSKSAFNALLKSIEEPPSYVLWVFATTERHKIPATIQSRCQQLDFRPVRGDLIAGRLLEIAEREHIELTRTAAEAITRSSDGSVRDALSLLDQLRAFAANRIDDAAVAAVLGVPQLEVIVELVAKLAGGDTGAGLAALSELFAAGHDATVVYQEIGRVLRGATHLAIGAELVDAFTDDQRAALEPLVAPLGIGPLTRMLGLWIEQEALVSSATNRELAVEVASLRLARWPAVQRLEAMMAGGRPLPPQPPPASGAAHPPSRGGGTHEPDSSPGGRLARALWDEQPRLAGAVSGARSAIEGDALVLRFSAAAAALARYVSSADVSRCLESACHRVFGDGVVVRVECEDVASGDLFDDRLVREAHDDPQVQLARRVLGGDIVAVRADRGAE